MKETLETSETKYKRVLIVVNKWWECDPVMLALLNNNARPPELGWPYPLHYPVQEHQLSHDPRAVFTLSHVQVEVWCISDLLAKYPNISQYQSSSERKMDELPLIFRYSKQPDLVVAVGTAAAYPPDVSVNGSVICGTKIFLHNAHPNGENPWSNWQDGPFDKVIDSPLAVDDFKVITDIETSPPEVMKRFLVAPLNPDPCGGQFIAEYKYVDLNIINVTDYSEYEEKDEETLEAYQKEYDPDDGRSLETTHGLIRVAAGMNTPFLFVSGIVDRVGHFNEDVNPRSYAQNTSGAHNAGIVVAWMLPKIDALFEAG
ncbi:MAG: hypothetical protein HXS48_02810 [Theionarchaea archaeon]|nr:hypothetical protein [Theionarchaea archaeon]